MNEKQLAERIREAVCLMQGGIYDEAAAVLESTAYELDPPKPEPGTVVWWKFPQMRKWEIARIHQAGNTLPGIYDLRGNFVPMGDLQWKPARILGPRQVAVDVPPVSEWPEDVTWIAVDWVSVDGHVRTMQELIHREEAERMEDRNER